MFPNVLKLQFVIYILIAALSKAQMVPLTQIYNNTILTNPSLIGLNSGTKILLVNHGSWMSAQKGYSANMLSSESFLQDKQNNFGIAGYVMDEGLGNSLAIGQRFNRTALGIGTGYHSLLGKEDNDDNDGEGARHYLSGGAAIHLVNVHSNWSNLVFSDQLGPIFGPTSSSPTQNILPPATSYRTMSMDIGTNYIAKNLLADKLGLQSDYQEIGISYNNISAGREAFLFTEILGRRLLKMHFRSEFSGWSERRTRLAIAGYSESNEITRTSSFLLSSTTRILKIGIGLQRSTFGIDAYQATTRFNAVVAFWAHQGDDGNGFQFTYAFSSSLGNSRTNYLGNNHELTMGYNFIRNKDAESIRGIDFL